MNDEQRRAFNDIIHECYDNSVAHGFHDYTKDAPFNVPEKLALIHSEVSEALEDYRSDDMKEKLTETGKPVGFPSEIADIVIRVFDLAGKMGLDLTGAIERKMAYNRSRPYKHGKVC